MAFHNEIGAGRYNRLLQKLFNMKGPPPARQLGTDVMPTFPFFSGVENRFLELWETFALSGAPTGGAGQSSAVRLRNPAGSNAMVVVHSLIISSSATINISIVENQPAALAGDLTTLIATTNSKLDGRGRPQPSAVASQTTNYGAIPAVQPWSFFSLANTATQLISDQVAELPLLPGATLDVICATFATLMAVSVMWRERPLEESELK